MESRHSMKKNVILCIDVSMQFSLCHRRAATTSVGIDIIWKTLLYSLGMTNDFICFSLSSFASNYGITEQSFRIFNMLYLTFVFPTILKSCISFHYVNRLNEYLVNIFSMSLKFTIEIFQHYRKVQYFIFFRIKM